MARNSFANRIAVSDAAPGMRVAEDIFALNNHLVIAAGTLLDQAMIARLEKLSIGHLFISQDDGSSLDMVDGPEPITSAAAFEGKYAAHVEKVKNVFHSLEEGSPLKLEDLRPAVVDIVNAKLGCREIMNSLSRLRNVDEYTYDHSLNVGILAMMLARWLGKLETVVEEVCFAGIFHDLGKALIPEHILNKPGPLTPEEFVIMREHSTHSYNLLLKSPAVSERVRQGVLDHHERIDGTGYPRGTKGLEIHDYGRIIAVADVYDAMISDRCYRKKESPFSVLDNFKLEFYGHLDSKYIDTFVERVSAYFVGERVELSDGRKAEISYINSQNVGRPVVKVAGELIDLSRSPDLAIVALA